MADSSSRTHFYNKDEYDVENIFYSGIYLIENNALFVPSKQLRNLENLWSMIVQSNRMKLASGFYFYNNKF